MYKIAIHQPNFCPWYPFFYKMAMVDKFVLLKHTQFEKNGYQNRFNYKGRWITKPVVGGVGSIVSKNYTDGLFVSDLNERWIRVIKDTLSISTSITDDWLYHETRPKDKTLKLIDIIKTATRGVQGKIVYVTNETAKDKYLNENAMCSAGIDIEYCKVPRHLQRSTFEIIEEYGIEGAIKQLKIGEREYAKR